MGCARGGACWFAVAVFFAGCGAKTGLEVDERRDAAMPLVPDVEPEGDLDAGASTLGVRRATISLSDFGSCAIVDGDVYCWGGFSSSPMSSLVPVRMELSAPALEVRLTWTYGCALTMHGTVWCWGDYPNPPDDLFHAAPELISGIDDAVTIDAGLQHACAVLRSGRVACFGASDFRASFGACASFGPIGPATAVEGIEDAVDVAVGDGFTCASTRAGRVTCWGCNSHGQLGDGTDEDRNTPREVAGLEDVIEVEASGARICARDREGSAWCWGENEIGTLGDGTTIDRSSPIRIVATPPVAAIDVGGYVCFLGDDGRTRCTLDHLLSSPCASGSALGGLVEAPLPGASDVSTSTWHQCFVRDGTIACRGCNDGGQLGDGTTTFSATPLVVSIP